MSQLTEFYDALGDVTETLPDWWACTRCPVAHEPENCCHKALFLITSTEWQYLRGHANIIANWERLVRSARKKVRELWGRSPDWSAIVKEYSEGRDFTCPLFDFELGGCSAYDRRPTICRAYGVTYSSRSKLIYGCPIASQVAQDHAVEGRVQFIELDEVLDHLASFSEGPTRPIIGWLAEENAHVPPFAAALAAA